jgi:hypothetical protein
VAKSGVEYLAQHPGWKTRKQRKSRKKNPLLSLVRQIARMKTEEEFGDQSPASEDWISTLNDLIAEARKLTHGKGKLKPPEHFGPGYPKSNSNPNGY